MDLSFPQALEDLLLLPYATPAAVTGLLHAGWSRLTHEERKELAEDLTQEPDPLNRVLLTLDAVAKVFPV